jgi:hypothetical protein
MRKITFVMIITMLLMINSACALKSDSEQNDGIKASFKIYLVKDTVSSEVLKEDLNKLKLEEQPLLTDKNISEYVWKTHQIKLVKDDELNKVLDEKLNMKVPVSGKPFVVVCNGERIYCGVFWTKLSSLFYPECPTIISDYSDRDYFEISFEGKNDIRNDKRIYETLKKLGKLK